MCKDFDVDYDRFDEDMQDELDYDDRVLEEQYENEQFAQDGDFHNMEYIPEMDCWG